MAQFDFCSDLHIDYWNPKWRTLHMKYGPVSDHPLNWNKMNRKSDILVIAGDVSDKLEYSIEYIKSIRKYYRKILFVDGNHEHTYQYPKLYSRDYIASQFKGLKNIHYLPKEDVIIGKTAFIGVCSWWDYGCKEDMEKCEEYVRKYSNSPDPAIIEGIALAKNILTRAKEEAEKLGKKLDRYENDDRVEDIVIVTHTVPLAKFSRNVETDHNQFLKNLNLMERRKIKRWVFGHNHEEFFDTKYGIKMMCHPRGRPADYDRINYDLRTSNL
mgnify:CR=1 FL=1